MNQSPEDFVDIREVFAILRRQVRLVLLTCLVVLALAFVYVSRTTPLYTATALIKIDPQETNLLDPNAAARTNASIESSRIDTEVEILKSTRLGLQTIERTQLQTTEEFGPSVGLLDKLRLAVGLDLPPAPTVSQLTNATLLRFSNALNVRRKGLTYLVSVSVTSMSSEQAAALANTHARVYIDDQVASRVQSVATASEVLRSELTKAERRLSDSNAALRFYVSENIERLSEEANSEQLTLLKNSLNASSGRLAQFERNVQAADAAFEKRDWATLAEQVGEQGLRALEEERQSLRSRLQTGQIEDQQKLDLEAEIARLEGELETLAASSLSGLRGELRRERQDQDGFLEDIQQALTGADLSAQTLTEIYALNQGAVISQRQYDQLVTRLRDLEAQAVVQVADSRLVAEALPPNSPSYPNKKLVLAVALTLAVGIGSALALLKEFYYGGVTSAHQLSNVISAKVAAVVPRLSFQPGRDTLADKVIKEPMTQFAEAYRKLRASLDLGLERQGKLRNDRGSVILVTSSIPAEGKSTTALALARTYALAGKRTLLIDADLRNPSINDFVDEKPTIGLLEYLQSNGAMMDEEGTSNNDMNSAEQFYVLDPLSKLGIILGSRRANVPTDAPLQSTAFKGLVENARNAFDVVIIDTAPLLPVVDTQYIAPMVDGAVVCVRFGEATQVELRTTMTYLRDTLPEDAVVTSILNCFEGGQQNYRYDGYYSG
ncbi:GumC family protein [Thalassovita mediterranea]|uniref:non-specific protein-tyrosine kinase n=1 Tax=Thalassovita mediterranea TaxID=340021 RepID=A0A0P1H3M0_9RHOB|nr:Wzz/FepE/Etk N-terminal domain-containing protein [Thalassovita mediterranea]CUH84337.1 Tyrosine-protein kinase ptk [Thalassovita mediterranea]SIS31884.1 capsular exopolysaccharide family [Thalassovita mediterranea]